MELDTGERTGQRPHDRLLDEAAEWIARLRDADVANADRRAFAHWLERSPAHRSAFDTMADLWDGLGVLGDRDAELPVERTAQRRRVAGLAGIAATLLVAAALWLVDSGASVHETARGERLEIALEDGSRLLLNTGTRVEIRMTDALRRVDLTAGGQIWVDVRPDASRPFVVLTAHGRTEAIGTAFDVHARPSATDVAVTEGRVHVRAVDPGDRPAGTPVIVAAGESTRLSAGAPVDAPSDSDADRLAWREGRLVYDDVRLADLVDDMNRYLPRRMTVADPDLADLRVSGVFRITDQDTMLEALSRALPLRWVELSDSLVILHPA